MTARITAANEPDVTLMDLRIPLLSGTEAIAAIIKKFPRAKIIVSYQRTAEMRKYSKPCRLELVRTF